MSKHSDSATVTQAWEKLGITTLPLPAVPAALDVIWEMPKRMTLCLIGDTGVGKTPIVHEWARKRNGFVQVLNFGHMSPEDISMPMFNAECDSYDFVAPQWFLRVNEAAESTGCAVLFLDEWNRGDKQIVNALFTLTDERRMHNLKLHENVIVVAAMNPSDGTYLVNEAERDHAIRKRLCFTFVTPDLSSFLQHAKREEYDEEVVDFVRSAPNFFYDYGARDAGKAFPCPSNWEKVSHIVKSAKKQGREVSSPAVRALLAGQVGYTTAEKFIDFVNDKNTLISTSEILYNYFGSGRHRIAKLLGMQVSGDRLIPDPTAKGLRVDVLSALSESLSITLFSDMPDPASIAECLAKYSMDIPEEVFVSFYCEHMRKQVVAKDKEGQLYSSRLSQALARVEGMKEKLQKLTERHQAIADATK